MTPASSSPYSYTPHWNVYPRSYAVLPVPQQYPTPLMIDGNVLDKPMWQNDNVPWSDVFGDIQGPDDVPDDAIIPPAITKFKALYDDEYLYIAAILHPSPNISTTEAHYTKRNSPIYQKDSDFEVFINVDNTNHNYKELEINAINTIWNLLLDKPYSDNGHEHSGRIAKFGDDDYYEVYDQKTATQIVRGKVNDDPDHGGALWTVEMALSYTDLRARTTAANNKGPPKPGKDFWRINFSRVELKGDVNWTWQPQNIVWNPLKQRYTGVIDMHQPDSWGYLYFCSSDKDMAQQSSSSSWRRDPMWPAKLTAMTVYHALQYHNKDKLLTVRSYDTDIIRVEDLILPKDIIAPFDVEISLVSTMKKGEQQRWVLVTVTSKIDGSSVSVRHDRLLTVLRRPATATTTSSE